MRKIALAIALMLGMAAHANAQNRVMYFNDGNSGYLGLRFVEPAAANSKVIVREVSKDSPAEKAGLKAGDEIVRVNGLSANNNRFAILSRTLEIGDTVVLRVKRGSDEKEYTVVAAKRPMNMFTIRINGDSVINMTKIFMDSAKVHLDSLRRWIPDIAMMKSDSGFDFRVLTTPRDSIFFRHDTTMLRMFRDKGAFPGMGAEIWKGELGPGEVFRSVELGTRSIGGAELTEVDPAMVDVLRTDKGLLVLRVAPETPADRAGLHAGDVIVRAKGRDVRRVDDLRAIVRANPDSIKLDVLRKGVSRSIELKTRPR